MTQGTVTVQDLLILGGIVELDLAGAEALGYFEHEASRFLHVREMGRASGTAGDGGYGRDRHANHRRGGHGAGLHDAVQVIDAVSVGRDVLIRDGKDLGQLANRILIDIQQILADLQDVAFLDGGGDRKAAGIDDVVSLGRVAGHRASICSALANASRLT